MAEALASAPTIEIAKCDVVDLAGQGWAAFTVYNNPPRLFSVPSATGVVQIRRDPVSGKTAMVPVSRDDFIYHANLAAQWMEDGSRTRIPPAVARHMWAEPEKELPAIKGIKPFPILHADGTIFQTPGYDTVTKLYYEPPLDLRIPEVPDRPTTEQVREAVDLIDSIFHDFPFVGERSTSADRAHAFAFLLIPFVRHLIDGPVPMFHVDAPAAGTGKSLLSKAALLPSCGEDLPMTMEMNNKGDYRKLITTVLPTNPTAIVLDNVSKSIDSPALLAMLTARTVQDRPISTSKLIEFEVNSVMAMTGNNIEVNAEMRRRTVRIRLNAGVSMPHLRTVETFRHPDLINWGMENRGDLIVAALVIAKNWLVSGRPLPNGLVRLGSFERFCETLGGMLHSAGVNGFLRNIQEVTESQSEMMVQLLRFLKAWETAFKSQRVTVSDLLPLLVGRKSAADLGLGNGSDLHRSHKLGLRLRQLAGQEIDGYRIERCGVAHHAAVYRLVTSERPQATGGTSPAPEVLQLLDS